MTDIEGSHKILNPEKNLYQRAVDEVLEDNPGISLREAVQKVAADQEGQENLEALRRSYPDINLGDDANNT